MLSSPLGPNPSVDCLTLTDRSLLPQTVHQGPEKGRKKGGETGGRGGGGFELGHFPVTGTGPVAPASCLTATLCLSFVMQGVR